MIPDYDYTLLVPATARDSVIDALQLLVDIDSGSRLLRAGKKVGSAEVTVSLLSQLDMPMDVVTEFPCLPGGGHSLGNVYLSIGPSAWNEFPNAIEFRLWPCTRRLQRAIFGSTLLRHELVRLLDRCGGYVGYIVNESSDPVEFWRQDNGPSNCEHPAEYMSHKGA